MADTLTIPRRCNGPPDSANGGYACGLVAERVGGVAEVTLRAPPPLEHPLRVEADGDGLRLLDGATLVAEGRPGDPRLDPPRPPALGVAERASAEGRDRWADGHPFPTCVTCGPERAPGDGLRIFPGALDDGGGFAATWTPDSSVANPAGEVPEPWVWAALDCPSSAPALVDASAPGVLARLSTRIDGPVAAGEPHVIVSWPLGRDGRKHSAGSAIFTAAGDLRAIARALWIELRPA